MKKQSDLGIFGFALIVCALCSLLLSGVSEGLRSRRELNQALDRKKNILKAVDLRTPIAKKATSQEILDIYNDKILEKVVDGNGQIIEGMTPDSIAEGDTFYPLYIYQEGDSVLAYCFPIIGKGLWSTLKGYFALEPDAKTVRGITFYSHGETPGLGAEIDQAWFTDNFKGKSVWDDGNSQLKPVVVVKGKVADQYSGSQADYYVDGISGATMTANGVTEMVGRELNKYEPFFKVQRAI